MSKRAKIGFFFLALVVMAILAGGSLLMALNMTEGLIVVGIGCALAAVGFVIKARVLRTN